MQRESCPPRVLQRNVHYLVQNCIPKHQQEEKGGYLWTKRSRKLNQNEFYHKK